MKNLFLLLGFFGFTALVSVGLSEAFKPTTSSASSPTVPGSSSWANKLNAVGPQTSDVYGLQANALRPAGTVKGGSKIPNPCLPQSIVVGKYLAIVPCNVVAQVLSQLPTNIPNPTGVMVPGTLVAFSFPYGVPASTTEIYLTYPGLAGGQSIMYWNKTTWVRLVPDSSGKYTIPAGTPNPFYVAVTQG